MPSTSASADRDFKMMPPTPISVAACRNGGAASHVYSTTCRHSLDAHHRFGPRQRVTATGEGVEQRHIHRDRRLPTRVHFDHGHPIRYGSSIAATPRTITS